MEQKKWTPQSVAARYTEIKKTVDKKLDWWIEALDCLLDRTKLKKFNDTDFHAAHKNGLAYANTALQFMQQAQEYRLAPNNHFTDKLLVEDFITISMSRLNNVANWLRSAKNAEEMRETQRENQ